MTTTAARQQSTTSTQQGVLDGALGGLAGGLVLGVMMHALGMIAMLVGSESVAVAWGVHLAISALFGAVYGAVVAPRVDGWGPGLVAGVAYGAVPWVVGPLLLMPAKFGMSPVHHRHDGRAEPRRSPRLRARARGCRRRPLAPVEPLASAERPPLPVAGGASPRSAG